MQNELLQRFARDRSPQAIAAVIEFYRPLVYSVCRRYLRRREDVEDAAQETFLKLAHHASAIHGSVPAWLSATAHTTSLELIRRATREQRRRDALARSTGSPERAAAAATAALEHRLVHEAIHCKLAEALLELDERTRELIVARFFRKTPLRVLAAEKTSVATMSRRVAAAVSQLTAVLRDMGLGAADNLTLAEHFGDPTNLPSELADRLVSDEEQLRFSPDWRAAALAPRAASVSPAGFAHASADGAAAGAYLPGWSRPIRVGALVSQSSFTVPLITIGGRLMTPEYSVQTTGLLLHPGFELVGVAEPGTTNIGQVERLLRDYDLVGGLIDSTDAEALKTLDVLLLGLNFSLGGATAAAIREAVESGVGLLNEWWTAGPEQAWSDLNLRALMLSASPIYQYHTKPYPCGRVVPATVREAHPLLPGLYPGMSFDIKGCGPVYQFMPGVSVPIAKNTVIEPDEHRIPGLGPVQMAVVAFGQLKRGRVALINVENYNNVLARRLSIPVHEYVERMSAWLAEPKTE